MNFLVNCLRSTANRASALPVLRSTNLTTTGLPRICHGINPVPIRLKSDKTRCLKTMLKAKQRRLRQNKTDKPPQATPRRISKL
ncbi:hypothetical protein IWQ62_003885 [Dispira parvispora]|uniref:Uncharacterized protein n=1 Tax=Dispira parvispora TaxID=1520584 RepID=A0A9W8AN04_9FUNG|nr:hypothetical protein IWQ62_003885 [Dispira parvispora]